MALKQHLSQKLEQRLSPQQIQLMKLLQVPTMELDQRIKQEIEENPALEEGNDESEDDFDAQDDFEGEDEFGNDDVDFDISDYFDDDTPDYKTQVNNHSRDDEERVIPLSGEQSFQERMMDVVLMPCFLKVDKSLFKDTAKLLFSCFVGQVSWENGI